MTNADAVSKLFLGQPVQHWMLIVPLHDSSTVNLHCSEKTVKTRALGCSHLDAKFEISVRDQQAFPPQVVATGMAALSLLELAVPNFTPEDLSDWQSGSPDLLANATSKLIKRAGPTKVQTAVSQAVKSFLEANAILDALRNGAPDLHEKVMTAVRGRARRLDLAGPQGGPAPSAILNTEIDGLVAAIKGSAPTLSDGNAEQIALGPHLNGVDHEVPPKYCTETLTFLLACAN